MKPARQFLGALLIATSLLGVAACGETYDLADLAESTAVSPNSAPSNNSASNTSPDAVTVDPLIAPIADDADLLTLFDEMLATWRGLDQRVIDANRAAEALSRLESIWAQAEPIMRRERPTALFGFQQAMDLARSAVDRRRPGDASKGLLILTNLTRNW
jgi:hypothetical protein